MTNQIDIDALALSELDSDTTYGANPFDGRCDALIVEEPIDAAALAEVPQAFLAYLDCQQSQWG